ncbi:beta-galactosidase trimerization domain-containing protein [Metabacillus malikii]|nr:beta-galactosidase trimerization domain-containing protein [Metabacillus malikii]
MMVSKELHQLGKIAGSTYQAEIAYMTNYDNDWDGEFDAWVGPYASKSKDAWFKALQYNHVPVDAYNLNHDSSLEDLKKYKVIVYPHAAIITKEQVELFEAYVKQGGRIIFGCRSGYKDETGQTYMKAFPGYLADLVGVTVEEFTREAPFEAVPRIQFKGLDEVETNDFNEVLKPHCDVEIVGTFTNAHFEGKPALVKRNYGKGSSYYFGGVFNLELANLLIEELQLNTYQNRFELPEEIELAIRHKDGKDFIFLLNYAHTAQEVVVKKEYKDAITGDHVTGKVTLGPFDVLVLE